jgi:hypothetical protein
MANRTLEIYESHLGGSGLCASSGIKKLEHDVSETGSLSVLNHWTCSERPLYYLN